MTNSQSGKAPLEVIAASLRRERRKSGLSLTEVARRAIYRIQAEPGDARASEPHMTGVVEHVVVGAGRALAGVAGEAAELRPGDYIRYPGDVPHVFEALEPGTLAVLLSEHI